MERIETDLCIIGAGSGGLSLAAGASQMGARVVLIEAGEMGGDCLNTGCVPSKALLAAAKHAHQMTTGGPFGVPPVTPQPDYAAAMEHVQTAIRTIAPHDSQERFEGFGVTVIRETGRFVSRTEVQAGDTLIRARRFVVATGSRPFVPPIPGLEEVPYLTNETLFETREKPEHLLIIGGGPIGLEMAQAHVRLGSRVTVVEGLKALHHDDPELAEIALAALRRDGVEIHEGAMVDRVAKTDSGVQVHCANGEVLEGSHLLLAVGRAANIERLDLDKAGIAHDRAITVDASLRTSNRRVYAIGDVAGGFQFTHVAGYHATVVARSILFGLPSKERRDHVPWVTYTDPEIAQVGLTETQAREKFGGQMEVARFDLSGADRAVTDGVTEGLIKVMVVKGRPVGASIAGPGAGELIQPWSLMIANGLKMIAMSKMIAPYPTLGDINKRAAGAYFSPRIFDNPKVARIVGFVQRWLP